MKKIIYSLILCVVCISCADNFDESKYSLGKIAYYLSCSKTEGTFPEFGGKDTIIIEAASSWTITCDAEWISFSSMRGNGNKTIYLQTDENSNKYAQEAVVTISLDDKKSITKNIKYSQQSYAVDLGLSVLWHKFDLGANSTNKTPYYFRWGETEPSSSGLYETSYWAYPDYSLTNISGDPIHDAATALLGNGWRIPTVAEVKELLDECTISFDKVNKQYEITGPNGNSIIMPLAGQYTHGNFISVASYWTSEGNSGSSYAHFFMPEKNFLLHNTTCGFSSNLPIRPVINK